MQQQQQQQSYKVVALTFSCKLQVFTINVHVCDMQLGCVTHTSANISTDVRALVDFNEGRDSGVAMASDGPSLRTDNHTSISTLNIYRLDALPETQSTISKH